MMEFHRNVVENYPAIKLPDDLRDGLDPNAKVRVTIEDNGDLAPGMIVTERMFEFRDGVVTPVSERTYTAS